MPYTIVKSDVSSSVEKLSLPWWYVGRMPLYNPKAQGDKWNALLDDVTIAMLEMNPVRRSRVRCLHEFIL